MSTYSPTAGPAVLSDLVVAAWVREVVLVVGGAALVGVAAQVVVPIPGTPVPVTAQTFAVLLVGAALGTRRGIASLLLYLVAGAAGIAWFAGGTSGVGGATFGYVVGFVLAAGLVGYLAGRGGDRTAVRTAATMTAGTLAIYLVGMPWLAASLDIGLAEAFRLGVRPFLVGDAIKVAVAAGLLPLAWLGVRRLERP